MLALRQSGWHGDRKPFLHGIEAELVE